jgi:hypothetical protein
MSCDFVCTLLHICPFYTSDPVLVTNLDTSLSEIPDDSIVKPKQDICTPIPEDTTLPDPERYVELVRDVQPNACMLDAWEIRQNTTEEMLKFELISKPLRADFQFGFVCCSLVPSSIFTICSDK